MILYKILHKNHSGYQNGYQNKKIGSPKTRKALFNAT